MCVFVRLSVCVKDKGSVTLREIAERALPATQEATAQNCRETERAGESESGPANFVLQFQRFPSTGEAQFCDYKLPEPAAR